ncbi:hypothetical protein F5884DRAFT_268236 [Xylogone sp. PMI_703]|nr:hypothetical protein F5884DRAFT_268236 [Xylogone sp. PMI_703]
MAGPNVLSPREAAINALLQYTYGLDNADAGGLQSSFTEDAILDLTKFSSLGMEFPAIHGREVIVDVCMKSVGLPLDTTHSLSNFRVFLDESSTKATITCYAEAHHFKKDKGLDTGDKDYFLVKSRYDAVVVREDKEWRIKQLNIVPLWSQGNTSVMSG